jgi:hypothetical protein
VLPRISFRSRVRDCARYGLQGQREFHVHERITDGGGSGGFRELQQGLDERGVLLGDVFDDKQRHHVGCHGGAARLPPLCGRSCGALGGVRFFFLLWIFLPGCRRAVEGERG